MTGPRTALSRLGRTGLGLLLCLALVACDEPTNRPVEEEPISTEFDHIFRTDELALVTITFAEGWDAVLDAYLQTGEYHRAAFTFTHEWAEATALESLPEVGVRIKGNVKDGKGVADKKYALKLNFDTFGGERFRRVDKLHLENNKPDPTGLREHLATELYRTMGVPAVRTTFAGVTVDGQDAGIFTLIQDVDKRFLKDRFGTDNHADDGNLYECVPPGCNLTWAGARKEDYVGGTAEEPLGLVQVTNEDDPTESDYLDLIHFLDVLNNTSDEAFATAFAEVFDVDTFLRWLAVAVAIADYDNYLSSPDNFFLYQRPDTGRFVYIPWDHNKAYGGKKCKGSFEATGGTVDPPWCQVTDRPLIDRVLAVPAWRQQYLDYLQEVVTVHFTPAKENARIDALTEFVGWRIGQDPNAFYTEDEYWQAVSENEADGSPMNLKAFVNARHAYLTKALGEL